MKPSPRHTDLEPRPLGGLILAAAWLLAAPGCAARRTVTIQTFREPPAGWTDLEGRPVSPPVERGHLDLEGDAACVDPAELDAFAGIADVALRGGDPRGFAGVFVLDTLEVARGCHCLAVRPGGEWRVWRSASPLEPVGGAGWQASRREAPTGFYRLGTRLAGGQVSFSLDGKEAGATALEAPGGADPRRGRYRFGLFARAVGSRWKSFIAGGSSSGEPFRPEEHVAWGDASDAEALLREAREEARAFRTDPSRMRLYAILAALEEARRALEAAGAEARRSAFDGHASRIARETRDGARRIGDAGLHDRGFAALASSAPGPASRSLAALPAPARSRVEALRRLPPLRLQYAARGAREGGILAPNDLWEAVREEHGALERARSGELAIEVEVVRASNEAETVKGERRVPVSLRGTGRLADLMAEQQALERRLPEDIADAEARANVLRAAAGILGAQATSTLRPFEVAGKTLELQVDDGQAIQSRARRIGELRSEIQREERSRAVEHKAIPATQATSSILVELSYSVSIDGKAVVRVERERTYLGIEQWTHPARKELGLAASSYSAARVEEAVRDVRERALRRFRTAVSREGLLSRLAAKDRLAFLARLARSTRQRQDRENLELGLATELGLEGAALETALRAIVE
ncbi:MAG: hypothetical protein HY721_19270 [Planctomycetes bacterium]|nr:hypothetical protein [Planctomycetota bacterium]